MPPPMFRLEQNYPNPFNPSTTIRFALPRRSHVSLTVFDMLGQEVATLVSGEVVAGYHEVRFDASGLATGVYFYRLQAGDFVEVKRLMCLK
ncbi:T9SS C-terminal target domain-containing protein, partial [bacterium]